MVWGRQTLAPTATGTICIIAPHIACSMKPTAIRCVSASVAPLQREAKISGPCHSSSTAAAMPNSGPVRKKRNGTEIGGACSKERACMTDARSGPADAHFHRSVVAERSRVPIAVLFEYAVKGMRLDVEEQQQFLVGGQRIERGERQLQRLGRQQAPPVDDALLGHDRFQAASPASIRAVRSGFPPRAWSHIG